MKKVALFIFMGFGFSVAWACPSGTTPTTEKGQEGCLLEGRKGGDIVLKNDHMYFLKGAVFIGNDNKDNSTLTIEPGTTIAGSTPKDYLVITRGSKIMAQGERSRPIVFTTTAENPVRGSWGGLVINGNAPINDCHTNTDGSKAKITNGFCEVDGEGASGLYGGNDPMDNSGVLKYARVEWAGYPVLNTDELNGIAFQGVGSGTLVDYIQVHYNDDDGVELFGGTVNVKHVLLTGNKDDSMDWTSGWRGKAQFVLIQQAIDHGNNGIEADNLDSPMDAEPRSNPTLANFTLIGSKTAMKGANGILLREGTGVKIYNSIVAGFKGGGLNVDHPETFTNGHAYDSDGVPGIHITNSVFDNDVNFVVGELKDINGNVIGQEENLAEWVLNGMDLNIFFDSSEAVRAEKVTLQPNMAFESAMEAIDLDSDFFDSVDYIGAIDPDGDDWRTGGWAIDLNGNIIK